VEIISIWASFILGLAIRPAHISVGQEEDRTRRQTTCHCSHRPLPCRHRPLTRHPCCRRHCLAALALSVARAPPSSSSPLPLPPLPSPLPSSSPASLVTITITHIIAFAVTIAVIITLVAIAPPSPLLPSISRHHRPLHRTSPSLPPPSFSSLPLPSSSPTTLIAVTIALSTLALFVAAIIIRFTLSSFHVAHHHGYVVPSSTLSCQPPPALLDPVAG
jgi:hypothetical protein